MFTEKIIGSWTSVTWKLQENDRLILSMLNSSLFLPYIAQGCWFGLGEFDARDVSGLNIDLGRVLTAAPESMRNAIFLLTYLSVVEAGGLKIELTVTVMRALPRMERPPPSFPDSVGEMIWIATIVNDYYLCKICFFRAENCYYSIASRKDLDIWKHFFRIACGNSIIIVYLYEGWRS